LVRIEDGGTLAVQAAAAISVAGRPRTTKPEPRKVCGTTELYYDLTAFHTRK
jgi:hypothetical protein